MKIYFAGSIRGGREDTDIYMEIIKYLKRYGDVLTEHIGIKKITDMGEEHMSDIQIYQRDMKWLNQADILIAEITTTSMGVGYEIGKAEGKIPIFCFYRQLENKKISAMISGNENITVQEYKDLDDLFLKIDSIFSEKFTS